MADSLGQIPFGKHKGVDIEDVPTDYLKWLCGEDFFREKFSRLRETILKELKYRERFEE